MNIIIVNIQFKKQSVEIGLTVCKRHMAYVFAYAYTQCVSTYVCLCGDLDCHCGFPSIYWGRLSDSNSELTDSVNLSTSLFWGPVIFTFQVQRLQGGYCIHPDFMWMLGIRTLFSHLHVKWYIAERQSQPQWLCTNLIHPW